MDLTTSIATAKEISTDAIVTVVSSQLGGIVTFEEEQSFDASQRQHINVASAIK